MASAGEAADIAAALENTLSADEINKSVATWYQV
jgi:hypothetical protein